MRLCPRFSISKRPRHGFSLVELSVVVAIISVVATFGLEAAANFVNRTATNVSRDRLKEIDEAVANFFKVYGRLPCPALRTGTVPTDANYGIENCTGTTSIATAPGGGLWAGMVPVRNLNLPMSYALDGFGSKYTYVVTKNLTNGGGNATVAGRFGSITTPITNTATDGVGGIEIRTGLLAQPCAGSCQILAIPTTTPPSGAAYIIFSHGADQRGAVNARGTTINACITATDSRVDTQNCVLGGSTVGMSVTTIPQNVFYDNRLNAGLNLTSYFNDVVVWRSKGQL